MANPGNPSATATSENANAAIMIISPDQIGGSVALQPALSWSLFFVMQAMMRLSLPSEAMHSRMTSEVQAAFCAAVGPAMLAVEREVAAMTTAIPTPTWRRAGWVRHFSCFRFMTLSSVGAVAAIANVATQPGPTPAERL
jgi:hypothetical protein